MAFLVSIWNTIKGLPGAILTVVSLLVSGGLWVWARRSGPQPPAPTPGADSPEHGKIDAAQAKASEDSAKKIRDEARRVREKLLGKGNVLVACCAAWALSSSCSRVLPEVRDIGPIPRAHMALEEACAPEGDRVCCSRDGIGKAIDLSAECAIAGEECRLALSAEREHRGVDAKACQKVASDLGSAREQRWWFALGGIILGSVVTGLAVGLGS